MIDMHFKPISVTLRLKIDIKRQDIIQLSIVTVYFRATQKFFYFSGNQQLYLFQRNYEPQSVKNLLGINCQYLSETKGYFSRRLKM